MAPRGDERRLIEVHEWKKGDPRPGTGEKPRTAPLDTLGVPEGCEIPQVGDVLLINVPHVDPMRSGPIPFRVVSREFFFFRSHDGSDADTPARFTRAWILVRRLTEQEWQAEE
jgi:hypothetical protein